MLQAWGWIPCFKPHSLPCLIFGYENNILFSEFYTMFFKICNVLNRKFKLEHPLEKIVTDVTYIKYSGKWYYLAGYLDLFNNKTISAVRLFYCPKWIVKSVYNFLQSLNPKTVPISFVIFRRAFFVFYHHFHSPFLLQRIYAQTNLHEYSFCASLKSRLL